MSGARKPVAGWEHHGKYARLKTPIGPLEATSDGMFIYPSMASAVARHVPGGDLEAAQLAAEDELFKISDALNALRGAGQ